LIRRGETVRGATLDQGAIDARAPGRTRTPIFSFRGRVLIAGVLFCAAFWTGVVYLIVR